MPIANYTDWLTALKSKTAWLAPFSTTPNTSSSNFFYKWHSQYANIFPTLTTPTTPVACDSSTSGAVGQNNTASGNNYLVGCESKFVRATTLLIYDRLCHQGGLSGNVTGAQTTNLPTAALTRYTSGEGVMMAVEVYTSLGVTASTLSVSYTNSSGTSGRTSPEIGVTNTSPLNYIQSGSFFMLPLQSGDTGVRSVESVTLSVATGTVGNFGITLLKPLAMIRANGADPDRGNFVDGNLLGGIPSIANNACLWRSVYYDNITTTPAGLSAFSVTLTES